MALRSRIPDEASSYKAFSRGLTVLDEDSARFEMVDASSRSSSWEKWQVPEGLKKSFQVAVSIVFFSAKASFGKGDLNLQKSF